MKRTFLFITSICCWLQTCSQKSTAPDFVAKVFVDTYFISPDRLDLLITTTGAARDKLSVENDRNQSMNGHESEIERPSGFHMIDSIQVDTDQLQYTFSVQYQGNIPRHEDLLVILKRSGGEWKVTDYRFVQTGE